MTGLRARGNVTVDLDWSAGALDSAVLRAGSDGLLRMRSAEQREFQARRGGIYMLERGQ